MQVAFDPPTNGHQWVMNQGVELFDELVIGVGVNPTKKSLFSTDEKITMIQEIIDYHGWDNVTVSQYSGEYLVSYAESVGAQYILRGIRNGTDAEYEAGLAQINRDINADIETIFVMPPTELVKVSSSNVKGMIGPNGWEDIIKRYVTPNVLKKLKEKHLNE